MILEELKHWMLMQSLVLMMMFHIGERDITFGMPSAKRLA